MQKHMRRMERNERGRILKVRAHGEMGRRIRDMGLVSGTELRIIGRAPLQDPVAIRLKGFTMTLRNSEADYITCETEG